MNKSIAPLTLKLKLKVN